MSTPQRIPRLHWAAALLCLIATVAGADSVTAYLQANPDITDEYWSDITGTEYSPGFQNTFDYAAATVALTYNTSSPGRFTGSLTATGLKPNFCYQTKLHGKPPAYFGADGDVASSEWLGYEGRWWRFEPEPAWNANDAEYEANKDDPDYVFGGYLVYDFFVTDADGSVDIPFFESENSYRVIWKTGQRTPGANDGPIRTYDVGGTEVGLYGEWEETRALPGELDLPIGDYNVSFWLTEESFHDQWPGWALAMTNDDIRFEITPEPTSVVVVLLGALALGYRARRRRRTSRHPLSIS